MPFISQSQKRTHWWGRLDSRHYFSWHDTSLTTTPFFPTTTYRLASSSWDFVLRRGNCLHPWTWKGKLSLLSLRLADQRVGSNKTDQKTHASFNQQNWAPSLSKFRGGGNCPLSYAYSWKTDVNCMFGTLNWALDRLTPFPFHRKDMSLLVAWKAIRNIPAWICSVFSQSPFKKA